jgi:polysaccharide biosynthesis/export protein
MRKYKLSYWYLFGAGLLLLQANSFASPTDEPSSSLTKNSFAVLLGPEDIISIHVAGFDEIPDKPMRIDFTGYIDVPVLGRLKAAGLSVPQLTSSLTESLKKYVWRPEVTIGIVEMHSRPVSVLGAVTKPGVYQMEGPKTLIEILSFAGGVRPDAGSEVKITRPTEMGTLDTPLARADLSGRYFTAAIPLDELMNGKDPSLNLMVGPHDVISVQKGELVYIIGEVKKPGGYTLASHETISLLKGLSLAEGPEKTASLRHARILRSEGDGRPRKEIGVDIHQMLAGRSPDISLQPDDILFIPNNTARSVALRGAEIALALGTGILIYRH